MRVKSGTWRERLNPQLHTVWHGRWRQGLLEAPRLLCDHELVLVTQGSCKMEVGDERIVCRAPYFVVVPPLCRHMSVAVSETRRICVHFDWEYRYAAPPDPLYCFLPARPSSAAVHPAPNWAPPPLLHGPLAPTAPELLLAESLAARWLTDDDIGHATARALLLEILVRLLSPTLSASAPAGPIRQTRLAMEIKQRLDFLELTSGRLRHELGDLGYRYEHLCRVFKRVFGLPPRRYLQQVRMENARRRLDAGGVSVKQVAAELGFYDSANFCHSFKRYAGQSPRAYACGGTTVAPGKVV
jgi:AraC-like DNA-binding protein